MNCIGDPSSGTSFTFHKSKYIVFGLHNGVQYKVLACFCDGIIVSHESCPISTGDLEVRSMEKPFDQRPSRPSRPYLSSPRRISPHLPRPQGAQQLLSQLPEEGSAKAARNGSGAVQPERESESESPGGAAFTSLQGGRCVVLGRSLDI